MDESPAHAQPRRRRRVGIAAVACAAVLATVGAGYAWTRHSPRQHRAAAATPSVVTTPRPAPAVPTPSRAPVPVTPHQYVPPAGPTAFRLGGHGFTITAHVCGMANIRPLDPPGEQHHTVCWVREGFGVAPGSHSATTYVLGHSWAEDSQEVLNKLSAAATPEVLRGTAGTLDGVPIRPVHRLDGYLLTLTTPTGTLTYKVRDTFGVRKLQLGNISQVMNEKIRNRIVLITCAELHGADYDYNIVVEAYLYSSVRKSAKA